MKICWFFINHKDLLFFCSVFCLTQSHLNLYPIHSSPILFIFCRFFIVSITFFVDLKSIFTKSERISEPLSLRPLSSEKQKKKKKKINFDFLFSFALDLFFTKKLRFPQVSPADITSHQFWYYKNSLNTK